jgi:hypothetical protein
MAGYHIVVLENHSHLRVSLTVALVRARVVGEFSLRFLAIDGPIPGSLANIKLEPPHINLFFSSFPAFDALAKLQIRAICEHTFARSA